MSHEAREKSGAVGGIGSSPKEIISKRSNEDGEQRGEQAIAEAGSATVAASDVLATIWAGDGLVSACQVASALDISRETARTHLDSLQTAGTLELASEASGGVWRLPDRGE